MDYNKPVLAYLQDYHDKEDNVFKKMLIKKLLKT